MLSQRVTDAQRAGTFTVLFDSGIRSGSDVIKALAMGAQAVLGAHCSRSRSLSHTHDRPC